MSFATTWSQPQIESPTLQARKQQMDDVQNCGLAGIFHRAVSVI